ncbi:MAG: 16S rRNA (cytidine(1402)-2'-O)-methyltransferase [Alphaproteobacteria bacterium]|nr:16S rRNA (cytidine(1402)-2'-O)-methyltransferase [Alphaproteobacteria bacterium]
MHTTEKERGWLLPDSRIGALRPGLYLVSGPIGNMGDVSLRALDTLAAVSAVLCEDTRVSGKLLSRYNIRAKLVVYNDHSDDKKRKAIIERIESGEALALLSDAGTPLISDPGYRLAEEIRAAGLYVTSVPGASAPVTALQLSGLPSDRFSFIGFLPPKSGARRALLAEWKTAPGTLLAFETAPRLLKSLADIQDVLGGRRVAVARELTKMFEEIRLDEPEALIAHYTQNGLPKGEIVLVIAPPALEAHSTETLEVLLKDALLRMGTKDAAAFISVQTGVPRKTLYAMALALDVK